MIPLPLFSSRAFSQSPALQIAEDGERRVATTPDVAQQLIKLGYDVAVEADAGTNASYSNEAYEAAGCQIARSAKELEKAAEEASLVGGVNQVVSYVRLRNARGEIVPYSPGTTGDYNSGELLGGPGT